MCTILCIPPYRNRSVGTCTFVGSLDSAAVFFLIECESDRRLFLNLLLQPQCIIIGQFHMWMIGIHTSNFIWLGGHLTGHLLLQAPEHEIENSLPSQFQPPLRIMLQFNHKTPTRPQGEKGRMIQISSQKSPSNNMDRQVWKKTTSTMCQGENRLTDR